MGENSDLIHRASVAGGVEKATSALEAQHAQGSPGTDPGADLSWLSDDEHATWRALIAMMRSIRRAADRQLQRDADMPLSYYQLLSDLAEAPDRTLRMSELALLTANSQSQVSHAVTKLCQRGWVLRQPSESDGRGFNAVLTDMGLAALRAAAPGHARNIREIVFDQLDAAERDQLRAVAERLVRHIAAFGDGDSDGG